MPIMTIYLYRNSANSILWIIATLSNVYKMHGLSLEKTEQQFAVTSLPETSKHDELWPHFADHNSISHLGQRRFASEKFEHAQPRSEY
jgi:hypothetical protein